MENWIIGIFVLLGIVGLQWGVQRWRFHRIGKSWRQGEQALASGDASSAEVIFKHCVKLAPLWLPPRTCLARALAEQGQVADGLLEMEQVTALEPRNGQVHYALGMYRALYIPQEIAEAVSAFQRALAHAPELRARLRDEASLAALRRNPEFLSLLREPEKSAEIG